MSFFDTFLEMLVILFGIAMGYAANKARILGGEVDQKLSKLLLNVTMPCLFLGSAASGDSLPTGGAMADLLWVALIFYVLQLVLAVLFARIIGGTAGQMGVWRYGLNFSNTVFIGYPVLMALFGKEILIRAMVFVLPANLITYTLGPLMLTGAKRFRWQQLVTPCVLASVAALVIALARIPVPAMAGKCLNFVGDITVPLSLLVVGSLLAGMPVGRIFGSVRLWVLAGFRLLVLPVLLWLILSRTGLDPVSADMAVILMAMPVAVNGALVCIEFGGDADCMAQSIFLTTVASIFTIPLVAAVFL